MVSDLRISIQDPEICDFDWAACHWLMDRKCVSGEFEVNPETEDVVEVEELEDPKSF